MKAFFRELNSSSDFCFPVFEDGGVFLPPEIPEKNISWSHNASAKCDTLQLNRSKARWVLLFAHGREAI